AAMLPGKAPLAVGLALWFEVGRRKSREVKLTSAILERFGVNRKAKYRALESLEKAGLVRVRREPRRKPVVTILDLLGQPGAEASSQAVLAPDPASTSLCGPADFANHCRGPTISPPRDRGLAD